MVSATASQAPARRPKERTTQRELERSDYVAGQRKSSCRMMMVRTMSLEFTRPYKGLKSWAREEYSPRGEAGQPSNRLHPGVRKQETTATFPFPERTASRVGEMIFTLFQYQSSWNSRH